VSERVRQSVSQSVSPSVLSLSKFVRQIALVRDSETKANKAPS